jgi:hypothetical protein
MSSRPGFVTATGIVVAVVLLAGVLAWTLLAGPVLFSPGPLNAEAKAAPLGGVSSHAALGNDCGACHPAPWSSSTMSDRCLDCHQGVGDQIAAKTGIHAGLGGQLSTTSCSACHPEHNGTAGALTALDEATFPHELTGYSLRSHARTTQGARFACADCHPKDVMTFDQAVCADCHTKIDAAFMSRHEATYGADCLPCHDGSGRDGANFDHSTAPFKLTGKHLGVDCVKCHTEARSRQGIQKTPQDCYACHAKDDEHDGAYGRRCEDCHTAADWGDATFDHAVFPLDHGSEERKAACVTCHPTDVKRYTCYGCHEHTTSNIQAKHEGKSLAELADCIRCHPGGRQAEGD